MFPKPMFPGTYVPRYPCSPVTMFPEPMFPGTYVPRRTTNMLDVVIGIGIPSELFDKQFRCVNGRAYIAETQTHTHARTHTHIQTTHLRSVHRAKCALFRWHPALLKTWAEHAIIISICSDKKISLSGVLLITVLSLTTNRGT